MMTRTSRCLLFGLGIVLMDNVVCMVIIGNWISGTFWETSEGYCLFVYCRGIGARCYG